MCGWCWFSASESARCRSHKRGAKATFEERFPFVFPLAPRGGRGVLLPLETSAKTQPAKELGSPSLRLTKGGDSAFGPSARLNVLLQILHGRRLVGDHAIGSQIGELGLRETEQPTVDLVVVLAEAGRRAAIGHGRLAQLDWVSWIAA